MRDQFERLGRAAPQAVHGDAIAAPHAREQRADRRLRRRDCNIDLSRLQQVHIRVAVDQRDDFARAEALGEQRRHDVVLVVVGDRAVEIHVGDVFCFQQLLVGDIAGEHQAAVEFCREALGVGLVVFDDLDLILALDRLGEALADVTAAADHHAPDRPVHAPQLAHYAADVFGGGNEKYLVAGFDHGMALGDDRCILAENRRHPGIDVRHVTADLLQLVTHQRPAVERAHGDQADLAVGELEHLQRFRKFDQLDDVIGDDLLGTDRDIHREAVGAEYLLVRQIIGGADTGDAGRRVEQPGGQLARDEIGFVAARHGEDHVGVGGAGLSQYRRMRRVAGHGAQIEAVLKVLEAHRIGIDYRDIVGFGYQAFGD